MRLLSDPVRVRILTILEQREACVQELADQLSASPQNVSHHLGALYRDGVLSRRKEGTTVIYAPLSGGTEHSRLAVLVDRAMVSARRRSLIGRDIVLR
jgi:DNA-binding transcriptional ArsR family regulator